MFLLGARETRQEGQQGETFFRARVRESWLGESGDLQTMCREWLCGRLLVQPKNSRLWDKPALGSIAAQPVPV